MFCKICKLETEERSHFWKNHKIKESDYYAQYEPRYDKLTNELILFKSPDNYFNTDFLNKNNLKKYLELVSKEEGLLYLTNWLKNRKTTKNLIYAPSNIELRTLCYPSIKFFHKYYGKDSYENLCKKIGLIVRFDYNQKLEYNDINNKIFIDTREQLVLKFDGEKEIKKLLVGDYSVENNPFNIVIERKSIQDFIGSICSGFDRFSREMKRAQDNNIYLIILIESKISNLFGFKHLGYLHTEASADYVNKRLRDLLTIFPNIQICCVDGRKKAVEFIENIYKLKNNPKTVDFQYKIDIGEIK